VPNPQGRAFNEVVQQLHPGTVISRSDGISATIAKTEAILAKGAKPPATL
jgi:hypothetical protein